jgi:hypothetical protein
MDNGIAQIWWEEATTPVILGRILEVDCELMPYQSVWKWKREEILLDIAFTNSL